MTDATQPQNDDLLGTLIAKFAAADTCWFGSVRPDGRAHVAPIWHVWLDGNAFVCTPSGSVRARNVAANPHVTLALPDPYDVLIIEGVARPAPEAEAALRPHFEAKYGWNISTDVTYDLILQIAPTKIMAWGKHGEGRWQGSEL